MLVKFCYLKNRKEKHEGVKRHRAEAKEAIDLQDYLSTMIKLTPEQLNTEIKNLEIKIFKEKNTCGFFAIRSLAFKCHF